VNACTASHEITLTLQALNRTVAPLFLASISHLKRTLRATGMHEQVPFPGQSPSGGLFALLLMGVPWWTGCGVLLTTSPPPDPQSLLRAVETGPESIKLEIFQVRIPADDPELGKELWSSVDEQRLDRSARRNLVRNGFRAGVLGGAMPDLLARKLNLQSEMPEYATDRVITDNTASPRVVRRVLTINQSNEATVQASDLRDNVSVLLNGDDGLQGQSYEQVQAVYTLRAERASGQRVALRLTPELRHGEVRNRYAGGDQGIFLVTPSRERQAYDRLMLSTELAAGELLVVGCLHDAPGSLGRVFHGVDLAGPAEQKLVLVRLLQAPPSEILADARVPGQ